MSTSAKASTKKPLILVVEDYVDAREMLSEWLANQGYTVHQANDGREGLDLLVQHEYDAIILDLALPRIDGWEFLRILNRLRSSVPVVVHSGHSLAGHRMLADLYGHQFIPKPADINELTNAVREAVASRPARPAPVMPEVAQSPARDARTIEALTRALAEVAGGACHDMANSLAVLITCVEYPDRCGEDAVRGLLRQTLTHVEELHRFVRQFYRTDVDPDERVPCSALKKVIAGFLPRTPAAKAAVSVEVKCDAGDVALPAILLRLLIAPLVVNSLEAAEARGGADKLKIRIRVHVLPNAEGLFVSVTDNGAGFGEVLPELKRALAEGRPFSTKGESRGYGLTHLARLVKRLNGRMELADQQPKGTSVEIHLPLEDK